MGVSQQISSREMSKVMKRAVRGVICTIIYHMDPALMLPMIRETGILTLGDYDPYYGELNKMIRRGTDDDSVINNRLLDILFTRDKWWIVFIRVCQRCEYYGVIEAIEGQLTTTELSELHRYIQCSTRQDSIEGRAEQRDDLSLSHRTPVARQRSGDPSLFSETMATTPPQKTHLAQGSIPWGGGQRGTRYKNMPNNSGRSPGPLNDVSRRQIQTPVRSSQTAGHRKPDGPSGLSLSDSRRQFEQRSSDSCVSDETKPLAMASATHSTMGNMQCKGCQMDIEYQNTEMNSNIGRQSPGGLIDDKKKITITKELINFVPKIDGTDTNNLSENNLGEFKAHMETTSYIDWNIPVPNNNPVGPNSNLTTRRKSNMNQDGNILSLQKHKIQNHPGDDDVDTSVVTDATKKWTYNNVQHDRVDSRNDNGDGGEEDNVTQYPSVTEGPNTAPYVSSLIIESQLDLQSKRQRQVIAENHSTEKEGLEAEKDQHDDPRSRHRDPEENYRKECDRLKSQDTNTQRDHQPVVMNTTRPNPETPTSAETRADDHVPSLSGPDHVYNPDANIPNFELLGHATLETEVQGDDDMSPVSIQSDTSQNARPGNGALLVVDNGTNMRSWGRRSSANTGTQSNVVISNTLQQIGSPLLETSDGSVYLSGHYSARSSYPQAPDYTHIPPPVHIVSLSETSEPPPVHEDLAEWALDQETKEETTATPR